MSSTSWKVIEFLMILIRNAEGLKYIRLQLLNEKYALYSSQSAKREKDLMYYKKVNKVKAKPTPYK